MEPVEVTAKFDEQGRITPLQFIWKGGVYHVESTGRRWEDEVGVHILVMVANDRIYELVFLKAERRWNIGSAQPGRQVI